MTSITSDIDPAIPEAGVSPSSGSFDDYPLSPALLAAVAERGMTTPTPIQATAIPALLNGRDVVGQARTGSGKTLAFSLPLLEAVDPGRASVQALVLAPTRELASQVAAVIADLGTVKGVTVALLYGGTSSGPQRTALRRGAQVAVGTPGRILDLISQGALWLDQARFVVLDEADEMFDQGFAQDVERIMDKTSNSRQTALFSATMPEWVRQTAARYLYDPETIAVDGGEERPSTVPHTAYVVPTSERPGSRAGYGRGRDEAGMQAKLGALRDLLDHRGEGSAIVFGRTKQGVAALSKQLDRDGYPVGALQGNMTQAERDFVMGSFREGRIDVLVATNVAARGLDLVGVNLVINVELPESAELLTHRVGRTGRMGRGGQAITLLAGADLARWHLLTKDAAFPIRQLPWEGAQAALSLGEDEQADLAEPDELAVPLALPDQPVNGGIAPNDQNDFPDDLVEEEPIMDEPFAPESFGAPRPADDDRPARGDRPTRRASRRAPDNTSTPARPSDDASDLIARALASVGAGGSAPAPAPPRPPAPTVRRSAPRPEAAMAREPVPQRHDEREQTGQTVAGVPVEPATRSAAPIAHPAVVIDTPVITAPAASGPLRGTPRPAWVRGAAERVAHWQVGASPSLMPETTSTTIASAPLRSDVTGATVAAPHAHLASMAQPAPAVSAPVAMPPVRQAAPPAPRPEPVREPAPAIRSEPISEPVAAAPPPERPAVRQGRATTPPPVRQPGPARPAEPVAAAVTPDIAPPIVTETPAPSRPEPPRIPTVRASRSRPAVTPAPEPVVSAPEPVTSVTEPLAIEDPETVVSETVAPESASDVAPEPGELNAGIAEPVGVTTDIASDAVTTFDADIESGDDATSATVAGPDEVSVPELDGLDQPAATASQSPAVVTDPEPAVVVPPTRRRSRTSRDTESPAEATVATEPVGTDDTAEPTPKPTRRASSRRPKADPESLAAVAESAPPATTPVATDDVTTTRDQADAAESPPATASRRSGSGRGRTGKTANDRESARAAAGDRPDGSVAESEPDPIPPTSRSRAPRTQPDPEPEPTTPKTRGKSRSAEQSPAGNASRGKNADQAAPGNRRSPAPRSGGDSGGGQRGRSAESGDDTRGNTGTPERGNSAQARPTRQSGGGYPSSGPPLRRRPVAAPANSRCAACGTPNPKGSTRKYCAACERELADRSQES